MKSTRLVRLFNMVTEWFSISRHCSASTSVQHIVRPWHSWKGFASFGRTSAGKWQFEGPLRFVVGISFANTCRSCSSLEEAFGKSDMCFCAAAFLWKMTSNTQLNKGYINVFAFFLTDLICWWSGFIPWKGLLENILWPSSGTKNWATKIRGSRGDRKFGVQVNQGFRKFRMVTLIEDLWIKQNSIYDII